MPATYTITLYPCAGGKPLAHSVRKRCDTAYNELLGLTHRLADAFCLTRQETLDLIEQVYDCDLLPTLDGRPVRKEIWPPHEAGQERLTPYIAVRIDSAAYRGH